MDRRITQISAERLDFFPEFFFNVIYSLYIIVFLRSIVEKILNANYFKGKPNRKDNDETKRSQNIEEKTKDDSIHT
jgi:hypothetical protein